MSLQPSPITVSSAISGAPIGCVAIGAGFIYVVMGGGVAKSAAVFAVRGQAAGNS